MNINAANFLSVFIFTMTLCVYFKEKIKNNLLNYSILLTTAGVVLSVLFLTYSKLSLNIFIILISATLAMIYSYNVLKDNINLIKCNKLFAIILLFFFIQYAKLIPLWLLNINVKNFVIGDKLNIFLTIFSDVVFIFLLLLIYFKELRDEFIIFAKNFKNIIFSNIKYYWVGLIIMISSNLLISLLIPNARAENEQAVQQIIRTIPWASFIATSILAPIIEEIVFRKTFYDAIKNKWLMALTSGIIFGALHVIFNLNSPIDLLFIIPYSSLGVSFGIMYYNSKTVFSSIFFHLIHNSTLTILSIILMAI